MCFYIFSQRGIIVTIIHFTYYTEYIHHAKLQGFFILDDFAFALIFRIFLVLGFWELSKYIF